MPSYGAVSNLAVLPMPPSRRAGEADALAASPTPREHGEIQSHTSSASDGSQLRLFALSVARPYHIKKVKRLLSKHLSKSRSIKILESLSSMSIGVFPI